MYLMTILDFLNQFFPKISLVLKIIKIYKEGLYIFTKFYIYFFLFIMNLIFCFDTPFSSEKKKYFKIWCCVLFLQVLCFFSQTTFCISLRGTGGKGKGGNCFAFFHCYTWCVSLCLRMSQTAHLH